MLPAWLVPAGKQGMGEEGETQRKSKKNRQRRKERKNKQTKERKQLAAQQTKAAAVHHMKKEEGARQCFRKYYLFLHCRPFQKFKYVSVFRGYLHSERQSHPPGIHAKTARIWQ